MHEIKNKLLEPATRLSLNYPECLCFAVISYDDFILFFWYAPSYVSKRQFLTIHAFIVKSISTFIWGKNYSGDSSKNS